MHPSQSHHSPIPSPSSSSTHHHQPLTHSPDALSLSDSNQKRPRAGTVELSHDPNKKPKNALSCSECKCDRKIPCEACIKRNKPEYCRWEEAKFEPSPQPFALNSDVLPLFKRLEAIESFLQTLPPELSKNAPKPAPVRDRYERETANIAACKVSVNALYTFRQDEDARAVEKATRANNKDTIGNGTDSQKGLESDMEDAATALEQIAFSRNLPKQGGSLMSNHPSPKDLPTAIGSRFYMGPRLFTGDDLRNETNEASIELTKALTCIITPRVYSDSPIFLASSMSLGICTTFEQVESARRQALDQLFNLLPSRQNSEYLVDAFFSYFSWLHQAIFEESFKAEFEFFLDTLCANNRQYEVDAAWLAIFMMVLAISFDGLSVRADSLEELQKRFPDTQDWSSLTSSWYAGCQRLLDLADYRGRPQVRTIQAIILQAGWIQNAISTTGQTARFLSWLSSAIRTAQLLGLHSLTDDPEHMPVDDPAWPSGSNSIKRETALRLFSLLKFMDYMSSSIRFKSYMILPDHCSTPPLSNVNLSELSKTDWKFDPKPRDIVTDASFEYVKLQIALQTKNLFDLLVRSSTNFSYETVLELDRGYRRLLDEIPTMWKQESTSKAYRDASWKRHIVYESIHSRIMRLHRPFMTRGYTPDSRFAHSTEECVKSARIVIVTHSMLLGSINASHIWFVYAHSLGAAIVLFCDLFHAIDSDLSEAEIDSRKEVLITAVEIFGQHRSIVAPHLRAIVQQGSRILSGLFMAEEKRRATRAARTLAPGDSDSVEIESFAQVLVRLTAEIDLNPTVFPSVAAGKGYEDVGDVLAKNVSTGNTRSEMISTFSGYSNVSLPANGPSNSNVECSLPGSNEVNPTERPIYQSLPSFLNVDPSLSSQFFGTNNGSLWNNSTSNGESYLPPQSNPNFNGGSAHLYPFEINPFENQMNLNLGNGNAIPFFDKNGNASGFEGMNSDGEGGGQGPQLAANVLLDQLATFF